ncbi:GH36-type glycosyl hydrolase domain-containing protein [Agarilytica rhodophyticola]|uniref:GH36-type glycosyl hydrolase domain-containing protein n=1 Tax=Agarilytica rhodophyticola TaxID=1737490 RepID=UPI000B3466FB|nr:NdvB protein [Agarilytica rhodophyticola]
MLDINDECIELKTPTAMPNAAAFLWNKKMVMQVNCRGFVVAQHMQPDASKYSHSPNIEAKTFIQPEQPFYAHHPGRFVYIKDEQSGELFSVPYEPVRKTGDTFVFSAAQDEIQWRIEFQGIEVQLTLSIPRDDVVELWRLQVRNKSGRPRKLSIYPSFTIGYMSWMNQSACYRQDLGGIVASSVSPYQKLEDYPRIKTLKDKTFFLHNIKPTAWETNREAFEGEGGLHQPSAVDQEQLEDGEAFYQTPVGVFQFRHSFDVDHSQEYRFLFGPAKDDSEIAQLREKYFAPGAFEASLQDYRAYIKEGEGCLTINTPDAGFDNFVNHWLGRQIFYHGDVNRLTNDPQTRNYLQDNMGMCYIKPQVSRHAFLHALSQQEQSGAMPDGILLHEEAQLQYINQIPHTDHCVWLPICLQAYFDETGDYGLLDEQVSGLSDGKTLTVFERVTNAMHWLLESRDARNLSYIAQGDWCDPMNMVGPKGRGVSGWLSVATVYALKLWADICQQFRQQGQAEKLLASAGQMSEAINEHLWDGDWLARGITDDNVVFGISDDPEGRIFLNPQSWSMLADCVNAEQQQKMIAAIEQQLETPYGVMMLAPAYTSMREDVGRVTQKYPGVAENGSVYNHAAIFYIYALYTIGESERAFKLLRQMIPGSDAQDYLQRGQLPAYIPNYYRGAYYQIPKTAGKSSQLFNTGTVSWVYRSLIDGLFGLRGCREGLCIQPQLPAHWQHASVSRVFRGATFDVSYERKASLHKMSIRINDKVLDEAIVRDIKVGERYSIKIQLPAA